MDKTTKTAGRNPLATEPVSRLLVKFAVPSVLSMLVDALYNIVDRIFIGRGVGYLGIAATTVTFPFVTIILSIATLLGIGGSVYTSMNLGAGRGEEAEKTLGAVLTLSVINFIWRAFQYGSNRAVQHGQGRWKPHPCYGMLPGGSGHQPDSGSYLHLCFRLASKAVSYTHLDVYKRQFIYLSINSHVGAVHTVIILSVSKGF